MKNDIRDLRLKSISELRTLLKEKETEISKVSLEIIMKKVKNVHLKKGLRKEIARIKTLINQAL